LLFLSFFVFFFFCGLSFKKLFLLPVSWKGELSSPDEFSSNGSFFPLGPSRRLKTLTPLGRFPLQVYRSPHFLIVKLDAFPARGGFFWCYLPPHGGLLRFRSGFAFRRFLSELFYVTFLVPHFLVLLQDPISLDFFFFFRLSFRISFKSLYFHVLVSSSLTPF